MALRAVVFDVGETLVDETRHWGEWADWLGIPRFTFFAVMGGVIARGDDHRRAYDLVAPGVDLEEELAERARRGGWTFAGADLYPDAAPCVADLRAAGFRVGIAANQPEGAVESLARLGIHADFVGSSAGWGTAKPSPLFFRRVADEAGCGPSEIAYVGDRVDNDVVPAATAGMVPVFVRRGPWGILHAGRPEASMARVRVDSLAELPAALARV
jgi:HAD superfamily hydrolase (TIGR01549 family)